MNIVIPMAGHSRRFLRAGFAEPKAMLPVGDRPMIGHVIDMFGQSDHFFIIVNEEQVERDPQLVEKLKRLAAHVSVVMIPPHEMGPTYSVLSSGVPENEPVIVSYCDLVVEWDYKRFLMEISSYDAAAPAFRGFHPASFGSTLYAYMRIHDHKLIELREKRSFTDDRVNEFASCGIYYFKSFEFLRQYAEALLARQNFEVLEAYTSLVLNDMVNDFYSVYVPEVSKFICLGTPEDYRQYRYWYKYFNSKRQRGMGTCNSRLINLIPMAGNGSRFKDYGYRTPKPLIHVRGEPMYARAADSLPTPNNWVFLVKFTDYNRFKSEEFLRNRYPNSRILPVHKSTTGQAVTCLLSQHHIDDSCPLLIASCDYEHSFKESAWQEIVETPDIDGAIWTYRMDMSMVRNPAAFAYCKVGHDGTTVVEVCEKRVISEDPSKDHMVVGTFWFRTARDFFNGASQMIEKEIRVNGEHYVGTSINQLILRGKKFVVFEVDQWVSFGDPHELKLLEYWGSYFDGAHD